MLNGWIKIHRKILDHWVSQEPELLSMWIRLLAETNHSDTKKMFNGSLVEIKRGQLIFGLNAFSAKSGITVAKLRRYLKLLETDGMINKQNTSKYSLITITCFDEYQSTDKQNTSKEQADNKQTTRRQQHRKNVKNEEEGKEDNKGDKSHLSQYDLSSWPSIPDRDLFDDWIKAKKKAKGSISQRAINTVGSELHKAIAMGYSVADCLTKAESRQWKGFEASWMGGNVNDGNQSVLDEALRLHNERIANNDQW